MLYHIVYLYAYIIYCNIIQHDVYYMLSYIYILYTISYLFMHDDVCTKLNAENLQIPHASVGLETQI